MLIELAQGIVQPGDKKCYTVLVQDGYVIVKIDFVHENAKDVTLPIPMPEADIYTLGDALTMWIQWKKSGILIPPIGRSSTSGAPKWPCTPTPDPENVKKDAATCDDPPPAPKKKRPATPKKKGSGKAGPKPPAQKATESKAKAAPKEPTAKNVWTSAHSKFVMGKPILSELDQATAGVNTKGLHKHYMTHANDDNTSIVGHFKAEDMHSGPGYFSVFWSDLYDVFNLDASDISLIRCLTL